MAVKKKVSKKKVSKKSVKKDIETIEENAGLNEDGIIPEKVREKENRTLLWFFVVVGLVFAAFLVPYFWNESSKVFDFAEISWVVEDYEGLRIYHGRFVSLTNPNLNYNIYLRSDPRENDVSVDGKFDRFKYGGVISLSPEIDACRGDVSRVMLDLGAFLRQGIGVGGISSASLSEEVANQSERDFVTCENTLDRTVVEVRIGEDVGIVQNKENPYCYTITVGDCEDSQTVEKFLVQAVGDFREALNEISS